MGGFSLVALSLTVAPPGTPAQVLAFRIDTHKASSHMGDTIAWTSRWSEILLEIEAPQCVSATAQVRYAWGIEIRGAHLSI